MTDQTIAEEAVEAAAWVLAGADRHADIGTAWIDCARRVLAAAYPHLRRQIETEVREQIAQEIRASGVAQITFLDGDTSRLGIHRRVGAEDAYNDCYRIVTAVGAAHPGGEQ